MMAAMEITEDTPITMPITVKAERTLLERKVFNAARKFSRACEGVMIAISQTSRRRWDQAAMPAMPDRFQKIVRRRSLEALRPRPPKSERRLEKECRSATPAQAESP